MKKILIMCLGLMIITISIVNAIDFYPSTKSDFTISGIDISHHNKIYNWSELKKQIKFCIIKASEGNSFVDPKFNSNWKNCKKNKIICGAYHFFSPGISAEKQFINYKKHVKLVSKDLPPILDVELKNCDMNEVNKWLELAEKYYGVKPIIYTEYFYFKLNMEGKIKNYPLWLYFNKKFGLKPSYNNLNCYFWQYNQKGRIKGINGDVDLDVFLSNSETFNKILIN